jgi:hypothetical protein
MINRPAPQFFLFLTNFLMCSQSKMRLISTSKKYNPADIQFLTTLSFFENLFNVNARKVLFASILFFVLSFADATTYTSTLNGGPGGIAATGIRVGILRT